MHLDRGSTLALLAAAGVLFVLSASGQEGTYWASGPSWIGVIGWFGFLISGGLLIASGLFRVVSWIRYRGQPSRQ